MRSGWLNTGWRGLPDLPQTLGLYWCKPLKCFSSSTVMPSSDSSNTLLHGKNFSFLSLFSTLGFDHILQISGMINRGSGSSRGKGKPAPVFKKGFISNYGHIITDTLRRRACLFSQVWAAHWFRLSWSQQPSGTGPGAPGGEQMDSYPKKRASWCRPAIRCERLTTLPSSLRCYMYKTKGFTALSRYFPHRVVYSTMLAFPCSHFLTRPSQGLPT